MNLTLNHWIRFVGIAATTAFVTGAIVGAQLWYLPISFTLALAGAIAGHWLAASDKGEGN